MRKLWYAYIYNQLQTTIHKFWVAYYMLRVVVPLVWRAFKHDYTKYGGAEAVAFSRHIFELKKCEYNSPEYKEMLKKIDPCLQHHYAHNSHHPQFYHNGFQGMSALDRIEMVADWSAAVRRNKNGCIWKSLEQNQERFGYTDADREWLTLIAEAVMSRQRPSSPQTSQSPNLGNCPHCQQSGG